MNFKQYSRLNNILGWIVFVIATYTYVSTKEATVSLWDCGEFIAASFKLEVVHPPGAPFFLMLNHFFTMFASSPDMVPVLVNFSSAMVSALTILFLFWTISALAVKTVFGSDSQLSLDKIIVVLAAATVGSLSYTWSDTFWFSAVEGEVYAMSSMFIALVSWLMMKWERRAFEPDNARWLILICFFIGLSSGVHLMSLLAIPAMAVLYYFKKFDFSWLGLFLSFVVGLFLLWFIQTGVIIGIPSMVSLFEVLFVNSFGLPFWTGAFVFLILIMLAIVAGIYVTSNNKFTLNNYGVILGVIVFVITAGVSAGALGGKSIIWFGLIPAISYLVKKYADRTRAYTNLFFSGLAVILIGYSSYAMVVIRSQSNPAIDMNDPQDVFSLLSYLNREQYGDRPILFGPNFTAYTAEGGMEYKKTGKTEYRKGKKNYEDLGKKIEEKADKRYVTFFPRMYSRQDDHIESYREWTGLKQKANPTLSDNIEFFFKYQLNHMWFRYFGWNFIGRQNDYQGHGNFLHGNDITGIGFIDSMLFGVPESKNLPESFKNDKSRNLLYGLPFLLGLFGLFYQYNHDRKSFIYIMIYFIMTGIALTVYLNMPPYQPRERDYVFVGSFYFFAIWIGLGIVMLYDLLKTKMPAIVSAVAVSLVCLIVVPLNMAAQEWNDHDRSNRTVPLAFGRNYLESCAPNAILFTNGDNDTYPLWYAQEVEGIRDDVRIINLSLLNTDWYVNQMRRPINHADSVHLSWSPQTYRQGNRDYALYNPNHGMAIDAERFFELSKLLEFIASDRQETKAPVGNGEYIDFFPVKKFKITVDKQAVLDAGVVSKENEDKIVSEITWKLRKNNLMKADMVMLDIIATNARNGWKRPIYWAITTGTDAYVNLMDYLQMEGLCYRLVPIKKDKIIEDGQTGFVNSDIMYDNLMNKFTWGGLDTEPDMWVDHVMMRQCLNFRNVFVRLSQHLTMEAEYAEAVNENPSMQMNGDRMMEASEIEKKRQMAIAVLDKGMEALPERNVPLGITSLGFSEMYYRLGETEKAFELDKKLAAIFIDELEYYTSLPTTYRRSVQDEIRMNLYGLDKVIKNGQQNKQDVSEWKQKLEEFSRGER